MNLHTFIESKMPKIFSYPNVNADFHFAHSHRDFVVSEIPLYDFSGNGEHQILQIRKKNLSTFELIKILSTYLSCPAKAIGYAGLKDKNATTTQYFSIPKIYFKHKIVESVFEEIATKDEIKLISTTLHNNKIKLGHLQGNRFFIRLKKVTPLNAKKIESSLKIMEQDGFANFFGFQRFGIDGENYKLGFALANLHNNNAKNASPSANATNGIKIPKSKKMRNFLRSSLQSFLFNEWLMMRLLLGRFSEFDFGDFCEAIKKSADNVESHIAESSALDSLQNQAFSNLANLPNKTLGQIHQTLRKQKQPFKLLNGDICCHYPHGRFFTLDSVCVKELKRFDSKEFAPTGALDGKNLKSARDIAGEIESPFLQIDCKSNGTRRYAWVWAFDCECTYKENKAQMELHFSLPSGAYATTMLEQIAGKQL